MDSTATRQDAEQSPRVFGERGDYWSKHDTLASDYDKDLLEGISGDLVLLSFGILFAGMIDYLWNLNRSVAHVVLVFTAVGGGLRTSALFLALILPGPSGMDIICAGSAVWMASTFPKIDILITVAQNITYITSSLAIRGIINSPVYLLLISQAQALLNLLQMDRTDKPVGAAMILARAVAHVLLADSGAQTWNTMKPMTSTSHDRSPSIAVQELINFWLAIITRWCHNHSAARNIAETFVQDLGETTLPSSSNSIRDFRMGIIYLHGFMNSLPSIMTGNPVMLTKAAPNGISPKMVPG
ncbi:hypothetical protein FRB97_002492, partial [Tulasnella sp. 331]